MTRKNDSGFSAMEVMIWLAFISIAVSVVTFVLSWIYQVKEARVHGNRLYLEEEVQEVGTGPEFGSFRITFDL